MAKDADTQSDPQKLPPDGPEMSPDKTPEAPLKQGLRSRLLMFDGIDGRTKARKQAEELCAAIVQDLGGEAQLTTLELLHVRNAVLGASVLRDLQTKWLRGEETDAALMTTLENTFNRTVAAVKARRGEAPGFQPGPVASDADSVARAVCEVLEAAVHGSGEEPARAVYAALAAAAPGEECLRDGFEAFLGSLKSNRDAATFLWAWEGEHGGSAKPH